MDRYEGPARLEWWANRSTCLASAGIRATITVEGAHWHATADLEPALTAEERDAWSLLMELSPYFTLVFPDEADTRLDVHVTEAEQGRLVLTVV